MAALLMILIVVHVVAFASAKNLIGSCHLAGSKVFQCNQYAADESLNGKLIAERMEFQREFNHFDVSLVKGLKSLIIPSCTLCNVVTGLSPQTEVFDKDGPCDQYKTTKTFKSKTSTSKSATTATTYTVTTTATFRPSSVEVRITSGSLPAAITFIAISLTFFMLWKFNQRVVPEEIKPAVRRSSRIRRRPDRFGY